MFFNICQMIGFSKAALIFQYVQDLHGSVEPTTMFLSQDLQIASSTILYRCLERVWLQEEFDLSLQAVLFVQEVQIFHYLMQLLVWFSINCEQVYLCDFSGTSGRLCVSHCPTQELSHFLILQLHPGVDIEGECYITPSISVK